MIVEYDSPHLSKKYETEIPCEADPTQFAKQLIEEARRNDQYAGVMATDEEEIRWCGVRQDGQVSPL